METMGHFIECSACKAVFFAYFPAQDVIQIREAQSQGWGFRGHLDGSGFINPRITPIGKD